MIPYHFNVSDDSIKAIIVDFILKEFDIPNLKEQCCDFPETISNFIAKAKKEAYLNKFMFLDNYEIEELKTAMDSFLDLICSGVTGLEQYLPYLIRAIQSHEKECLGLVKRLRVLLVATYLFDQKTLTDSDIQHIFVQYIENNANECTTNELDYLLSKMKDSNHITMLIKIINAFENEDARKDHYLKELFYLSKKGDSARVIEFNSYAEKILPNNCDMKCVPYVAMAVCNQVNRNYSAAEDEYVKAINEISNPNYLTIYQAYMVLDCVYMYTEQAESLELNDIRRNNKLEKAKKILNDWIISSLDDINRIQFLVERSYLLSELGDIVGAYKDYREAKSISEKSGLTMQYTNINTHTWIMSKYLDKYPENGAYNILRDFWEYYSDFPERMEYTYEPIMEYLENDEFLNTNENEALKTQFSIAILRTVLHAQEILTEAKIRDYSEYKILYYTKAQNLKMLLEDEAGIDKNKTTYNFRLPLFSSRHMNDPQEGKTLQDFVLEQLRNHCDFLLLNKSDGISGREEFDEHYMFIKSFFYQKQSTEGKVFSAQEFLPMWVQYGDDAQGCCVVLSNKTFERSNTFGAADSGRANNNKKGQIKYSLRRVIYLGDDLQTLDPNIRKAVEGLINGLKNIGELCKSVRLDESVENTPERKCFEGIKSKVAYIMSLVTYLFKTDAYKHEQEARLLVARSRNDLGDVKQLKNDAPKLYLYPDMQTYIDEVILGSKMSNDEDYVPFIQMQGVKMWKDDPDGRQIHVTRSALNYR